MENRSRNWLPVGQIEKNDLNYFEKSRENLLRESRDSESRDEIRLALF